jgi:hypothetical protein
MNQPTNHEGNDIMNSNYETSASPLENTGSTEVTSGAGADICVANVQDLIEAGQLGGESTLHVEARHETVSSSVPATCSDGFYSEYEGNGTR